MPSTKTVHDFLSHLLPPTEQVSQWQVRLRGQVVSPATTVGSLTLTQTDVLEVMPASCSLLGL